MSAILSVIKAPLSISTSLVSGCNTFWLEYLPTILSLKLSITLPLFSSVNASTSIPWIVPQSSSLTMISCTTSTKRLVKYPASAVLSAVSAVPFLDPCVDKKNSWTSNPSRNEARIGISTWPPSGLAIIPRIPASWPNWLAEPLAPELIIIESGFSTSCFNISPSLPCTLVVASVHNLITLLCLSSSVIRPRLNCLLIFSIVALVSSIIVSFSWLTGISESEIVIPDLVLYLNPISFSLSKNIEVSVVLYLLNIWAIIFPKSFLIKAGTHGILATSSGKFLPFSIKNLSGVITSMFSLLPSST